MLPLLAKIRFSWTLGPSDQLSEELRHLADWKVARIQGPVSVRQQHALKDLRQLSPKTQAQLAPTLAFARHSRLVSLLIFLGCSSRTPNYPSNWHFPTAVE
jgi:hypothetical protein